MTATMEREHAGRASLYQACPGGRHWGRHGAAGALPYAVTSKGAYVLLSLRSEHVQAGGTWSTTGGAIEPGETPHAAAFRELYEELEGIDAGGCVITGVLEDPCPEGCGWSYTTFLVQIPCVSAGAGPNGTNLPEVWVAADAANAWESDDVHWWPARAVDVLADCGCLHPAFAEAWPALRDHILAREV